MNQWLLKKKKKILYIYLIQININATNKVIFTSFLCCTFFSVKWVPNAFLRSYNLKFFSALRTTQFNYRTLNVCKVTAIQTQHSVRSDSVGFMRTCTVRADLLSAAILSRLKDQTAQINFLSDFYRSVGHVFMGFRFCSHLRAFPIQQNTVFIFIFLLTKEPFPIKTVLTLVEHV